MSTYENLKSTIKSLDLFGEEAIDVDYLYSDESYKVVLKYKSKL